MIPRRSFNSLSEKVAKLLLNFYARKSKIVYKKIDQNIFFPAFSIFPHEERKFKLRPKNLHKMCIGKGKNYSDWKSFKFDSVEDKIKKI